MRMVPIDLQRPVLHLASLSFEAQVMFNQGRHVALDRVGNAGLGPKVDGGKVDTAARDPEFCCCRAHSRRHGSCNSLNRCDLDWLGRRWLGG